MKIPEVKIIYDATCPLMNEPIHREINMSQLNIYTIASIYSDIDDGRRICDEFNCPSCGSRHEIILLEDRPFG